MSKSYHYQNSFDDYLASEFRGILSLEKSPAQISDIIGWWDASDEQSLSLDGQLINSINDKSGMDNHISENGSLRPLLSSAEGNTPAVISNNKSLQSQNTISNINAETLFIVIRIDDALNGAEFFLGTANGGIYGAVHSNTTNPWNFAWLTASSISASGALRDVSDINVGSNAKFKVLRLRRSVAKNFIEAQENGLLIGYDTHSNGNVDVQIQIGGRGNFRGVISWKECIWFNRDLSDSECEAVEDYLIQKHEIQMPPEWSHTYNDFVKRYALAYDINSPAEMNELVDFHMEVGDSTMVGYAPKADFDSKYLQQFSNLYQYNSIAPANNNNWVLLDSTNSASRNDMGLNQSLMGMNAVFMHKLQEISGNDNYCLKYSSAGSHLANISPPNNWNVKQEGDFTIRLRRYFIQAMDELVLKNGKLAIDKGCVIFLGTNDMNDADEYNNLEENYLNLFGYIDALPGRTGEIGKIFLCEIWSSSPTYASGLQIARQAQLNAVSSFANAVLIEGMDSIANTQDGTHPNAQTYMQMAQQISQEIQTSNIPSNMSNLAFWIDAQNFNIEFDESGNISLINDNSYSNHHAIQDSLSLKPNLLANAINNKPAVHFANGKYLQVPSLSNESFPESGTLLIAADIAYEENTTPTPLFDNYASDRNHIFIRPYSQIGLQVAFQKSGSLAYAWAAGIILNSRQFILSITWDTQNNLGTACLNGSVHYSAAINDQPWKPDAQLVNFISSLSEGLKLGEAMIFDHVLSEPAILSLHQYLSDKWQIPLLS